MRTRCVGVMTPVLRSRLERVVRGGQVDDEARTGDRDGAAVALGDGPDDRQAEAGAAGRSAPEALEGVLGLRGARAFVADAQARAAVARFDRDGDAALAVPARVGDEVGD